MAFSLCTFCSSSEKIDPLFFDHSRRVGELIGSEGMELIYGGASCGLMGEVARCARRRGARVTGIIPEKLLPKSIAPQEVDELIITKDMASRKAEMERRADGFLVLPGGFGTLEEALEVMTLKQLGYHSKPIVFLNVRNFFSPLLDLFEGFYRERFAKEEYRRLYAVFTDSESLFPYLKNYVPEILPQKW